MHLLKNRSIRFYLVFFMILAMTIGGSALAAFADSPSTQVAVNGAANVTEQGPASVSATPVTLNGTDQTATYTLQIAVNDDTGTGNGWKLTITSTQFSTGNCTTTGHNLATTASSISSVAIASNGTGTYTSPTNGVSGYPLTVPAACTAPTAIKFFSATANTGMGHFNITPTVSIAIPANAFAGTYSSTVTLAIASGP
jgi:hypothetical protein